MGRIAWPVGIATAVASCSRSGSSADGVAESTSRVGCNLACVAFAVFATVCAGLAARSSTGRKRAAWGCMSIGLGGWVVGSAPVDVLLADLKTSPFPSLADAGYLLFPIAICVGLAVYPVGYSGHSHGRLVLDGLIVVAALFQISWILVLARCVHAGGSSRFAFGLALAYPVGDLVVIAVALLVLARARPGQRRTLTLLTAGVILMALSDSAFVYLTAHRRTRRQRRRRRLGGRACW